MRLRHLAPCLSIALSVAGAIACAPASDDAGAGEDAVTASKDFYGDDRVGAALKGHPESIPSTFEDFEELFGVGRKCQRAGNNEIYVVEERQTRLSLDVPEENMHDLKATKLMPRFVVTGCNKGNASDPKSVKDSYSLMAALISDPNMKGSSQGDTVRLWPVEVMALDKTTGLYNFYVFEPAVRPADLFSPVPRKTPGKVTRIFLSKEDRAGKANQGEYKVFQQRLEPGAPIADPVQPAGGGKRCFNCHVNGAPLMNEIHEPWTNWVSPKKRLPETKMSGPTQELVSKASLADQLEGIITAGIDAFVGGAGQAKDGWVNRTRDGLLPGGASRMLESLFCQTELNYVSADTTLGIPGEVFTDPSVTTSAGLTWPDPPTGASPVPFLFPIRSTFDTLAERVLVKRGYLTDGMAVAIRLVDDENDIFSTKRCGLLSDVKKELKAGEAPEQVKAAIKSVLEKKAPSLGMSPARLEYFNARLAGTVHQTKQQAYNAELQQRFATMDTSAKAIAAREATRKARAREMFDNPRSNPRPILDPPSK